MRLRQSQQEVSILKKQVEVLSGQNTSENDIIGESSVMQEVFTTINKLSNTDANILILGENGSGIGLSLCKQIMTLHDGSINVKSEIGKGSCFILTFPK